MEREQKPQTAIVPAKKELAPNGTYEVAYMLEDNILGEPFAVFKPLNPGRPAWWMDVGKVTKLVASFKMGMSVGQALNEVRITKDQYYMFLQIHPSFADVKERCAEFLGGLAKRRLLRALGNPMDDSTFKWYLERTEPQTFGRQEAMPAGAATKVTGEAWLDAQGKVLVSKQTAEILRKKEEAHGDGATGAK